MALNAKGKSFERQSIVMPMNEQLSSIKRPKPASSVGAIQYEQTDSRSPILAFALAVVPGCALHGIGYQYAGNHEVFEKLMTMEVLSFGVIFFSSPARLDNKPAFAVGLAAFGLSWVFDLLGAPGEAIKFNKEHRFRLSTSLYPERQFAGVKLAINLK